eukprot:CAMPEP_0173423330 /NCGR_PEP_ID=MMETSP1357-20121228/3680_1 /TAXON_ID=77926 /ORGANISM="Hemiselmis rufescens, Strain PCC563" /LENGTH=34 /DNA_ID= /DNA_START= /DNA_END= /DNA_ORIENTATION=
MEALLGFFGVSSPKHISWGHAVNSQALLDQALGG